MTRNDTFDTVFSKSSPKSSMELKPLASQVIMMLSERQTVNPLGARQVIVDYLVRVTISPSGFDPVQVMHELRGYRLTIDSIIDLYIPQAAVCLGEMWQTSDIDFAAVTVGALRLQTLLSEATMEIADMPRTCAVDVMRALIVLPKGEQHFLGANVVAGQLRRMGCEASVSFCEEPKQVHARVSCDRPDMILFSCARMAALGDIARMVAKIRNATDPIPVMALGGAVRGDSDGIKQKTGVDLVTNSAKDVLGFCTKRLKALGRG
jgi:methylmalonyl-CoA mutase cobalamin-binding subunit